ncbi:MAG: glycoside hydrolase family 32 protein, partial [Firmicutes bacterium]|nr:glycoside hydrolase family 32 protein [Bacillota bacterium]
MEITIKNNYLIFPVNSFSTSKNLTFSQDDKPVYRLDIKIDYYNPNFHAYIDVSRFIGQMIDISVNPQMKLDFHVSDEIDINGLYNEPLRPQIHFTTKNGWLNDPNGLIYLDGIYHMFYQYNPAESSWGNMHWGHATSTDLVHWTEKKTALFPDDRGMMFSGSAISDQKNLLGKNTDNRKAALLYYTTTSPFSQCLSYSSDGFQTIEKYSCNPVIEHIEEANRDPKVVFCDELGCYIMALYLKGDVYCLFKSDNLVNWSELQRLSLPGDNECPDIFPLTDSNGNRKWIFIGAHSRYLVGEFKNGRFEPEQETISLQYGCSAYAAQTFSNLPCGRIVRIDWDRWGLPAYGFNGQMGIPTEMSLCLFD